MSRLAAYERQTAHDVKAVEYFVKQAMAGTSLDDLTELVHLACTSEDINNLAYALMVRGAVRDVWLPAAQALVDAAGRAGPPAARRADAGAHARPAGHADDAWARSWP